MADYLIVKTSALGDILQAFPVLSIIREQDEHARIDWAVESRFESLVRSHPMINRALVIDSKKREWGVRGQTYDVLFDLQGNCKSAVVTGRQRARVKVGYTAKAAPEWPNALVTKKHLAPESTDPMWQQYVAFVCDHFECSVPKQMPKQRLSGKSKDFPENSLMLCPCTRWQNKTLGIEQWCELVRLIDRKYAPHIVLVVGSEEERNEFECLGLYAKSFEMHVLPSFGNWQQMMSEMVGVLSVDSCALHLALLADVPTFSLFGPSSPTRFLPRDLKHRYFFGNCPYDEKFEKRCKQLRSCPTGGCLRMLHEDAIVRAFSLFWEDARNRSASQSQCETPQVLSPLSP